MFETRWQRESAIRSQAPTCTDLALEVVQFQVVGEGGGGSGTCAGESRGRKRHFRGKSFPRRKRLETDQVLLALAGLVSIGAFRIWTPFQVGAASNLGGASDVQAGRQPSLGVPVAPPPSAGQKAHQQGDADTDAQLSASLLDSVIDVIGGVGGSQDAAMAQVCATKNPPAVAQP